MNTRVLIVGAGYAGRLVAGEWSRWRDAPVLVGFLDDDPDLTGDVVAGVPVLGPTTHVANVVARLDIDEVVVAIPSLSGDRLRILADTCRGAGVAMRTLPSSADLLGRTLSPTDLRPVQVGDLLRRAEITCHEPPPAYLQGETVLVTGAGGSIGRELCRQIARANPERLILVGRGENSLFDLWAGMRLDATVTPDVVVLDVRHLSALEHLFDRERPSVVFHAAAHKHVPLMEAQPCEAVLNNVQGTRNVLHVAAASGVERVVFVSTDKAVAPASVMGATKRLGEWLVSSTAHAMNRPYVSVRFGNVLGSRGSVVPLLERQIARGGPVTLTHPDMLRYFMTTAEAVHLLLTAGGRPDPGALVVLDMGEPLSILQLARDMIRLSGAPGNVEITFLGLRPGEKLVEALWEPGSRVRRIGASRLLLVSEPTNVAPPVDLSVRVEALVEAAAALDAATVRKHLADLFPNVARSLPDPATRACAR